MRTVGSIFVALILAIAASVPPATAQSLADNRALLMQELQKARAQESSAGCRDFFFRKRSRTCRSIRARISALRRELSGADAPARSSDFGGTFRTICVRVCDGYYYTLSHTSSRKRISQDAERCAGQYPPGEAVLFYHTFPSDDVSRARTLDGKRYADQDYAFAFRKAFMPRCAAQLHQGLAALRERVYVAVPTLLGEPAEGAAADGMPAEAVPVAPARPNRSSDPETLANRAGGFVPRPVDPAIAEGAPRTVGDPYYFAQANPGPPSTVAGYVPPVLKDFRVKQQHTSALEERRRKSGKTGDAPAGGPF